MWSCLAGMAVEKPKYYVPQGALFSGQQVGLGQVASFPSCAECCLTAVQDPVQHFVFTSDKFVAVILQLGTVVGSTCFLLRNQRWWMTRVFIKTKQESYNSFLLGMPWKIIPESWELLASPLDFRITLILQRGLIICDGTSLHCFFLHAIPSFCFVGRRWWRSS